MARTLIWSDRARIELFDLLAYVDQTSPGYAERVADRFEARTDRLPDQPGQGRRLPENETDREIREVFVHRWRLIYEVTPTRVVILAVIHGARDMGNVDPV